MDTILRWLESTALSEWIVGSSSIFAFPGILCAHAIGMGLAAGIGMAFDLRVLGVAGRMPLPEMRRFMPLFWAGFAINAVSGVLLLIGYPTKALTNPVFYLKLLLIGAAMALLVRMSALAFGSPAEGTAHGGATALGAGAALKRMAAASLLCWTGAITAGRLLAYTYTQLRAW